MRYNETRNMFSTAGRSKKRAASGAGWRGRGHLGDGLFHGSGAVGPGLVGAQPHMDVVDGVLAADEPVEVLLDLQPAGPRSAARDFSQPDIMLIFTPGRQAHQ